MPLVYSGQEVGLRSRLKFFDKDEIDWTPTSGIGGLVTKLTALKKRNSALWNGSAGGSLSWLQSDSTEVFSYARQLNRDRVVVVVNPTDHANKVTVTLGGFAGKYVKLTDGKSLTLPATYVATLKPYAYEVFSSK